MDGKGVPADGIGVTESEDLGGFRRIKIYPPYRSKEISRVR
jgi:hypothetical protein